MRNGLPGIDVAAAATSYSLFGGVLVGFALFGLFWYLTEGHKPPDDRAGGRSPAEDSPEQQQGLVAVMTRHVTRTVFYATASLVMTSFLFANLAGEAAPGEASRWAVAALVPYGTAFGLSVLVLFYGLTLVMLERGLEKEAAWAYWVVACAGPAVVLRFLLGAAAAGQQAAASHPPGGLLSRWAIFGWVLGTALVTAGLMLAGLDWPPGRTVRNWLRNRPALPPLIVFILASLTTGLLSAYLTGRPATSPPPPSWWVPASTAASIATVWAFALACGCVIGERLRAARAASDQAKPRTEEDQRSGEPTGADGEVPGGGQSPGARWLRLGGRWRPRRGEHAAQGGQAAPEHAGDGGDGGGLAGRAGVAAAVAVVPTGAAEMGGGTGQVPAGRGDLAAGHACDRVGAEGQRPGTGAVAVGGAEAVAAGRPRGGWRGSRPARWLRRVGQARRTADGDTARG